MCFAVCVVRSDVDRVGCGQRQVFGGEGDASCMHADCKNAALLPVLCVLQAASELVAGLDLNAIQN